MKILLTLGLPLWFVVFAVTLVAFVEDHVWLRARKRARQPGLNTVADADAFVEVLRHEPVTPLEHHEPDVRVARVRTTPLVRLVAEQSPRVPELTFVRRTLALKPIVDARTPIFDELCRDVRARRRALRWPTQEMRSLFDALVERWMCTHCEYEGCDGCPGCSCSCRMAVAA